MRFQIRQRIINGVLGISGKEHVYGLLKVSWEKILSGIIPDVRRILKIKIAGIRLFARLFKPCKELSTYLGGNDWDIGYGIAVDTSGNAYVTGYTLSPNFPTASALYGSLAGGWNDAFVTKLNASGSSLVYSTYLGGGSGSDYGYRIAVDTDGNAYVTGFTSSEDFPTASAIYESFRGGEYYDAFVTKLNPSGSSLEYSTYLGGWDEDEGSGIAVDTAGNAYVTGTTYSSNFPTKSAYDSSLDGGPAVFVTKIGSELSTTTDATAPVGSISINDGASYTMPQPLP